MNKFHGELPLSLQNCTSLIILDLSHNLLTGHIHPRILGALKSIAHLILRNNKFFGILPASLCELSCLLILDLSANHIFGAIPKCINNLQSMKGELVSGCSLLGGDFGDIMWKRNEYFDDNLNLVYIAISDNKLQGEIPAGITSLTHLASLDLARNNLTGNIPSRIGQLKELEFLDLSSNHLSGEIPTSLTDVRFLAMLDLSNNNLSGRIPIGTQLQGFDPANYSGNPLLCGPPLPNCAGDQAPINKPKGGNVAPHQEHDDEYIFPGLYISILLGFITGFWGVCGTLVLKRSWRHAYFRFFDDMKDRLYVMFAVNIARVWRKPCN